MDKALSLYLQNVEKISSYLGVSTPSFALRYTLKGNLFHYADYEKITQEIKKQTKWYSFVAANPNIVTSYSAHFGKDYQRVASTLQYYKILTSYFTRGEHSYLAAMYGSTIADAQRVDALTKALMNLPLLKYFTLPLQSRALLATRPEEISVLASSIEQYYNTLVDLGFVRHTITYKAAFLCTFYSGTFDAQLIAQLKQILAILKQTNITLKKQHYFVVILLAITKANAQDLIALSELQDALCKQTNLKPNDPSTLLIATQLYTAYNIPVELSSYDFSLSEIIDLASLGSDAGGDGGAGGE